MQAQFQKPTDEELKMTSDPKAPGADAVYLKVIETDDNVHYYESFYARIKVLTEKGKELATVELPYVNDESKISVKGIKARTIHPDGTIIPLDVEPEDLLVRKVGKVKHGRKVFNLPSVEVGSILEYYYEYHYRTIFPPDWEIQKKYFVHQAQYIFDPSGGTGFSWWSVLPTGAKVKKDISDRFVLELSDIPPAPNEEWMPPIDTFLYKVRVFYGFGASPDAYWNDQIKGWSFSVDQFVAPSKAFRETVNGLLAPGDSDTDKAKKLYRAVQGVENIDFSLDKTGTERKQLDVRSFEHAEDAWTKKSGNLNQIALLYLSMLRAAGLTANAMRVVNRDLGIFSPHYIDSDQLDDTLVAATLNGKDVVLDPGQKMCPFGLTSWIHAGASGIREGAAGGLVTTHLLAYEENKIIRVANLTLDNQGTITGTLTLSMTGQEALYWRQLAFNVDQDELKKKFAKWIEALLPDGVEVNFGQFTALDEPDQNLTATLSVSGTLGAMTSKRMMLPLAFFETRGHHPFVDQEKRQEIVDMHYSEQVNDKVVYHLPDGLNLEGAPPDAKIAWEGHSGFIAKVVTGPKQLVATRSLTRAFTFVPADGYKNLRDFYQKVAASDQQQIVLSRTPATPKGN
jgi:hypothetical protein